MSTSSSTSFYILILLFNFCIHQNSARSMAKIWVGASINNTYIKQCLSQWQPNPMNTQINNKGLTILILSLNNHSFTSYLTPSQCCQVNSAWKGEFIHGNVPELARKHNYGHNWLAVGIILKSIMGNSRSIISSGLMYSVPLSSCFVGLANTTQLQWCTYTQQC